MGQDEAPDCTDRCKSTQHGDIITAAISRRCVSDFDLCSYISYICTCCESVKDSLGRTALHVAASCGRLELVRWLIHKRHANINIRDDESGFTPLHRSIFYGKIHVAVELIKLGANTSLLDANSLTVLEHAMLDGYTPEAKCGELYAWGSNCNNSLGPQQSRSTPELLDVFHKKYPDESVRKVVCEKFHSVIVTSGGLVYTCGHGQGGRLGLGTQRTVVAPEMVTFPQTHEPITCVDVAVSRDHSVFLCSDGNLYSCGLNTHRVLGLHPPPAQILVPTLVKHLEQVRHVCAGRYHSVAWGPKCLYTWGLNAGQLGHKMRPDDNYVTSPKAVRILNFTETEIVALDSSDGAISIYTKKGDIYVLHEYQCRKIASRQLNVVQVCIFGGKLNTNLSKELSGEPNRELKVAALTNTGNLLIWQESVPQLSRCIYSLNRPIVVRQMTINNNGLLFVTKDGEAFQGTIKPKKKKPVLPTIEKSAFHKFLDREDCISIKLSKFPRIHRAIFITSDVKGHDFCVIQVPPYKRFEAPLIMESQMKTNLGVLLQECHENDDLHDVVLHVDHRYFPAHRFILATKSSYFQKLLIDGDKTIKLDGYNSLIFEQFLTYVYVGDCDLLKCGECPEKLKFLCEKHKENSDEASEIIDGKMAAFEVYNNKLKNQNSSNNKQNRIKNPVRMLHEMAKKFGCFDLCTILADYEMQKYTIRRKSHKTITKPLQFDKTSFVEFSDVTIKCTDGKQLKAHKCILAAQSDYFSNLFSTRWRGTETTVITLPCSRSVAEALLEYLYTDTLSLKNREQDHLFKLIILADQLFITRLKEQCELLLFECLTLKNCVQFLAFASIYNAEKLKLSCLRFIAANLAPLLELRVFDDLDELLMRELSDFYFEEKREIWCRVITPYSTAPLEEEIVSVSSAFPVSTEEVVKTTQKRRSRHKTEPSLSKSLKENICDESIIQFPDSPPAVVTDNLEIPSRLKAIKLAEEKLETDDYQPQYTKLVSKNSFEEFPLLNSPPTSYNYSKSPHKFAHKIVKVSQKQRKRLSSESAPESPKNPWKIVSEVGSPPSMETSMSEIISSEKKQKENLVKITSKSLIYTQIEDKAIEDLCKFYNTENINDEFISVERVNMGAVAAPIWVPGVKK
ncbi:inhibitor of Bruton tyrosine kinase [Tribolium castaneum]|uniref:Inhibitor of Bruton tyrosine kinase-like Protein n=1 Tax=Tribolium castaneum TaxID=7070 RepID=D6WTD6_TRICA|nr:PREDICTED: inhibitor of Bruton tyrosine kinase [Tribolium castaneum]EFA06701.1 Inhibitor of Bruton tyrosine kinase-like Protein [Tribolium castaneum]|eukprot:XP_008195430.1 PREDICTED: inhibitor of Bruton tyrosine kinase [Tribolium castaneum]